MGQYDLEGVKSNEFADYGLNNIREDEVVSKPGEPVNIQNSVGESAQTTLYRSPSIRVDPDSNHFGDPNLFGWSRSFEEGGVRHVVELQSDLAQKLNAKPLTEAERTAYTNAATERQILSSRFVDTSNFEKANRTAINWIEGIDP